MHLTTNKEYYALSTATYKITENTVKLIIILFNIYAVKDDSDDLAEIVNAMQYSYNK